MADFSQYTAPTEEWIALANGLPPTQVNLCLEDMKASVNQEREAASAKAMVDEGLHSQVSIQDYVVPTRDGDSVELRTYRPSSVSADQRLPIYLHLHGGGFLFGTLGSEDALCSRLVVGLQAENTPVVVVNVNYRHTPEHKYPAAWDDTEDAFHWVHEHLSEIGGDGDNLVIGGISAGAWLTASITLAQHLRKDEALNKRPKVKGQVLMIPALVGPGCYAPQLAKLKDPKLSSYVDNEFAPILPLTRIKLFNGLLQLEEGNVQENDRRISPGNTTAEEVQGLPPTTFGIAGADPLRDEGLLYAKLLAENGVPTDVSVFPGLPHGFSRYSTLSEVKRWNATMAQGIKWALNNPQATGKFEIKDK